MLFSLGHVLGIDSLAFSLGHVGGGLILFSLGHVLGLLCNPAESTQKALGLPGGASWRTLRKIICPRIALQSCGIYSKANGSILVC